MCCLIRGSSGGNDARYVLRLNFAARAPHFAFASGSGAG